MKIHKEFTRFYGEQAQKRESRLNHAHASAIFREPLTDLFEGISENRRIDRASMGNAEERVVIHWPFFSQSNDS